MQQNVGGFDRIVRLVIGVLLVGVGVAGYFEFLSLAVLGVPALAVVAVVVLVGLYLAWTGATRQCPIYAALGTSTVRADEKPTESAEDAVAEDRPRAN